MHSLSAPFVQVALSLIPRMLMARTPRRAAGWLGSIRPGTRHSAGRPSFRRFRIPPKYASGSKNVRRALEGIPYLLELGAYAKEIACPYDSRLIRINFQQ